MHYFGAHYTSNDLIDSAQRIKNAGGNLIQIFLTIPGDTKTLVRTNEELAEFRKYLNKNNMQVVVHSAYTHNIARDWDPYSWWIKNLQIELEYAHSISAIGLVLHFGKMLDLTIEEAFNNMYTSLIYLHTSTLDYSDVPILLETSTGQGSETCYRLEELARFYKKFSKNENIAIKKRFKICIDTCHIFAAGYDLRTIDNIDRYLEAFEELIGIHHIQLVHLNDCKVDIGEQRDRHANIGKGYIGINGLKYFFKYFKKRGISVVLETPNNGYEKEIKLLQKS